MKKHDLSILAVDDDEITLDIICDILDQFGCTRVQTAQDGRSGFRAMAQMQSPPDIIIVDVFMPDMDGIEFVNQLSRLNYQGGVILISAADAQILQLARQIAVESGLNLLAAFAKPFQKETLAAALGLDGPVPVP